MTCRIAIIDCYNQDIGLKILFPQADYYIKFVEFEEKRKNMNNYKIIPQFDFNPITDKNYDFLFIIFPLYNIVPNTPYFNIKDLRFYNEIIEIINKNNFKKVCLFDNYDFDYDPNNIVQNSAKIDLFFKRNMNKTKSYKSNVIPFPFIMFGYQSMIELIDKRQILKDKVNNQFERIFFTGCLTPERRNIYDKIANYIYNPGSLNFDDFLKTIQSSKYSLDLNGAGNPNKRTFEIVTNNSLLLSEYNDLTWPFEETFCEETIIKNADDFKIKINNLRMNKNLYEKCFAVQQNIIEKYFNREWLKNYISVFSELH
jgi:hypothetical protein